MSSVDSLASFTAARPRLLSIAYRMTGSRAEAEDLVQETWLRWQEKPSESVEDPAAYLVTIVTRLSVDHLRSARVQRERYVGPWLPEPIIDAERWLEPQETAEQREQLSLAVLALLERLSARQRAVLVLRDAFAYPYEVIARVLGSSPAACRQLHRRAQNRLAADRPQVQVDPGAHRELLERFLAAAVMGDLAQLEAVLARDVVLVSDGAGQVSAARRPVVGAHAVARFFVSLAAQAPPDTRLDIVDVNGLPGLVVTIEGSVSHVLCVAGANLVERVAIVRAPDKLACVPVPAEGTSQNATLDRP